MKKLRRFKGFKHLNILKIINQIKSYLGTIHTSLGECKPTGASLFVRKSIQNHTKNATGCLNFGKTPPDSTANNPKLFQFIACTSMKKLSQFCLISLGKKSLKNPIIAKTLYQTCSVNFPKCWFGILRSFTGILLGTDSQEALHRSQPHQGLYLEQQLQFNQSLSSVLGDAFETGAIQICWLRLALKLFSFNSFPPLCCINIQARLQISRMITLL